MNNTYIFLCILQKSSSETDLYAENERLGVVPSEFCDDSESIHSTTDVSETASQDDFINSQGVRFMPHTYIKEGMYIHTCIKTTLPCLQVDFNNSE